MSHFRVVLSCNQSNDFNLLLFLDKGQRILLVQNKEIWTGCDFNSHLRLQIHLPQKNAREKEVYYFLISIFSALF